jgi:hypothetical protein
MGSYALHFFCNAIQLILKHNTNVIFDYIRIAFMVY